MNRKILALGVCILAMPVLTMAQSVYKWTDKDGVTHFGDRQPSDNQSESVSIRSGKRSDGNSMTPQQKVDKMAEEEAENAEQEELSADEQAREKQRAANCKTAKSNLTLIRSGSRIKAEENGEERFLTSEEIAEKREQFEEIAELNCDDENQS